ncbi:MAG: hypothetical protein ACREUA_03575 [Burkholderiales bacterium]
MKLIDYTKTAARIRLDADEASHLLAGLETLRKEIGTGADELIALLRAAGISPPPTPSHIRTEYAGPQ